MIAGREPQVMFSRIPSPPIIAILNALASALSLHGVPEGGILRMIRLIEVSVDDEDPNESRYLGQNSIAAFLSDETGAGEPAVDGDQDDIRKDIMPILGLQTSSAPYPFMSKDHMDKIRQDIAAALPSDRDVLK